MTKGLISIIIPVYQVSEYVERCIRSVMNQTFTDIECIIVDDATEDNSIKLCQQLIDEYKGPIRFRILHHEMNRGLSAARNTGTKAATGEYFFYLDSDDEITPDCIEKHVSLAQKYPEVEMVIGNYQKYKEGTKTKVVYDDNLPTVIQDNEEYSRYYYQHRIVHSAWNKLIKRSFIENNELYFTEGILYEDYPWLFYVSKYASFVCVTQDVTYHYYLRKGSITMTPDDEKVGESYIVIYNDILNHLTPGKEKYEMAYCVERFCKHYLAHKDSLLAYKELHGLFTRHAREYGCWYAYMVLTAVAVIGQMGNPLKLLSLLHAIRWKLTPLFIK